MNFIIAIINPHKLSDVRDGLNELGISGMTISEVNGYGRQKGHTEIYRGSEYAVDFIPKTKIEIAVDDSIKDQVIETIQATANSGNIGDGKIFVLPITNILRIRTGEVDNDAL